MKLGIIGSRTFNNYNLLKLAIQKYFITWDIDLIVSGGANGADKLAEQYATEFNIKVLIHYADWSKGRGAGFTRNHEIWKDSDVVVAFWDGQSKGTLHSFKLAEQYKKEFLVIEYLSKKVYWYKHRVETTSYYDKSKPKIPDDFEVSF